MTFVKLVIKFQTHPQALWSIAIQDGGHVPTSEGEKEGLRKTQNKISPPDMNP